MFCLYIVGDTQVIVAKAESGHYDVVGDALNLFTDLAQVFVRILVILSKKESEKERRERERRRRH